MAGVAYDPGTWHDFFVAAAGATAALSGLIFVAVSISLRTILDQEKDRQLISAAGSAVSPVRATLAYQSSRVKPVAYNLRRFIAMVLAAAYAISGLTLLARGGGGLHWLLLAFLLAVTIAVSNAWILLVEVLR